MMTTIEQLHRDHASRLLSYLMRRGQSREDARDVVQETMVRAWRHVVELDSNRVSAWLRVVARNETINRARARASRVVEAPPLLDDVLPANLDVEAVVIAREASVAALAAMSPEQRRVVVLRHVYGLSVGETAAALGVPAGTVKSREFYGIRAARRSIGGTT